ncbi:hypothetical protein T05_5553 [Trichinella murrelli]|uniref:Uncharacterized protein n=1 Tax=Trichinella murrelli TaxID=144512 RepID=A0A0V0TE77_9BILA|nr:hypothetical protein T05_5553 [Trichinella murrelli]
MTKRRQALMQIHSISRPFQQVGMDLREPLAKTRRGSRSIMVWPEAFPLPDSEAVTVATALVNGIFCHYGAPETLHSD